MPILSTSSGQSRLSVLRGLSFLAPVTVVVLPTFLLALGTEHKDEAYEWTQHAVIGAGMAATFLATFLFGRWRESSSATLIALAGLASVGMMVLPGGLPGFHLLFGLAGAIVGIGYYLSQKKLRPPDRLKVAAVGLGSVLSFWAVAQLPWWQPFDIIMANPWAPCLFLSVTLLMAASLYRIDNDSPAAPSIRARPWLDIIILILLTAVVLRTNPLWKNPLFAHHWSVFIAPAEMIREGRHLLGEVPSQYGFMSIWLLAVLPGGDRFTVFYWLHSILTVASGIVIYYVLRTWLAAWWWQIIAGLTTICAVGFLCGYAAMQYGSLVVPSTGAVRFIWVHVLLGFMFWLYRRKQSGTETKLPVILGTGSVIWLIGVLWSIESAGYVTAIWLPAASLFSMKPMVEGLAPLKRLLALISGIVRILLITFGLLGAAVIFIILYYHLVVHRAPEWHAYWEYATAFSGGFGTLPIYSFGGVWVLVLLHIALLTAIASSSLDRQRYGLALMWAAWGALWTISTYFVSRSHMSNITTLSPLLLLIVGLLVHATRNMDRDSFSLPWLWLTVPAFTGGMLWLVLTNPVALENQIRGYSVRPHVADLLTATPPELSDLIAHSQQTMPGPYSVIGYSMNAALKVEMSPHDDWLPLRSLPLLGPLDNKDREKYLDAYRLQPEPGWLIAPETMDGSELSWLFNYIGARYTIEFTLKRPPWRAFLCIPKKGVKPAVPAKH